MSMKEGERKLALVLKDSWILKSCSKVLLFQCSKGIIDIILIRRGVEIASLFESQLFQKEMFERIDSWELHQRYTTTYITFPQINH